MPKLFSKFLDFFRSRTLAGADKFGNRYFAMKEEVDGVVKEKRRVIFKGEDDPTSIPVEWICWLNGQRKKAPSPEEMIELEARRERLKLNIELRKREEEEERKSKRGIVHRSRDTYQMPVPSLSGILSGMSDPEADQTGQTGIRPKTPSPNYNAKVKSTDLKSFVQQFPGASFEKNAAAHSEDESASEANKIRSTEPTGSGESFKPGTWQPPT